MDVVDLRGKPCPVPVIEVKKILKQTPAGSSITVLVDNDIARQNLQKMAQGQGCGFSHTQTDVGSISIVLTVNDIRSPVDTDAGKGLVVSIGSDCMGQGDAALGRTLMQSFIFSLTELDTLPAELLFFNGGVKLVCEGSSALDDITALAHRGVVVKTCGACLNFYTLTDKIKVGEVTTMFAIATAMAQAQRVINM